MDGKNGLRSRMLFSELYTIMVNKVTFAGFRGAIAPIATPGSAPAVRLVTSESTRFDNKDSEPKAQVRLLKFPEENSIFSDTLCQKHSVIFPVSEWERMLFAKRQLQDHKVEEYKNKL